MKQLTACLFSIFALSRALPSPHSDTAVVTIANKPVHKVENIVSLAARATLRAEPANSTINGFVYQGCQTDLRTARVINDKSAYYGNLTYAQCSQFCSGYQYFGVEFYSECYCSNTLANSSVTVQNSDCWMPCSGDQTTTCGGNDRISVFKSPSYKLPAAPGAPVNITGYAYRGCYADKVGARTLNGSYFFDETMTTTKCAALCKGSTYFGTEFGGECYCSAVFPTRAVQLETKACDIACKGDGAQNCGGGNKLSVYWKTP